MSNNFRSSRRSFAKNSILGAAGLSVPLASGSTPTRPPDRLPREVWIGSISTMGLHAESPTGMVDRVLKVMDQTLSKQPDIICLPEGFPFAHAATPVDIAAVAEDTPGPILQPFIRFAKTNGCYVICPTYTREGSNIYIAAVLINRRGEIIGEYRKARPAIDEINLGVVPGPLDPPIFETDFGKIGIQICFDVKWDQGWSALQEKGAEIIFWPSAYAGGREISSRAWRHQVYIVTSTQKDTSKICDLTGETIAATNRWQSHWVCAPVNLEKAFISCWPAALRFTKMQEKYGRKIRLTVHGEEEWATVESLDGSIKVEDVLLEFDIVSHRQLVQNTAMAQEIKR